MLLCENEPKQGVAGVPDQTEIVPGHPGCEGPADTPISHGNQLIIELTNGYTVPEPGWYACLLKQVFNAFMVVL